MGPPVGGFITTYFHWRWIFWINLPIAVLGMVLATLFIPNVRGETISRFDYLGFVLSGIGLAGLVSASAALDASGIPLWIVIGLFLVGSVSVGALHLSRSTSGSTYSRSETFTISDVQGRNRRGLTFSDWSWRDAVALPLQLQLGFGMTPLNSGLLTFVAAIGAIGMKTAVGKILKRFGFRTVLLFNAIVSGLMIGAPAIFTRRRRRSA